MTRGSPSWSAATRRPSLGREWGWASGGAPRHDPGWAVGPVRRRAADPRHGPFSRFARAGGRVMRVQPLVRDRRCSFSRAMRSSGRPAASARRSAAVPAAPMVAPASGGGTHTGCRPQRKETLGSARGVQRGDAAGDAAQDEPRAPTALEAMATIRSLRSATCGVIVRRRPG